MKQLQEYDNIHEPIGCTGCGAKLDSAAGNPGETRPPRHGDHVVCVMCGEIMFYEMKVKLLKADDTKVSKAEWDALLAMQEAVKDAHADS